MAGSTRWFQYTADSGITFAVELDESNYESTGLGFGPVDTGATGPVAQGRILQASASRPLKMRRIGCFFVNSDGETVTRSFWVGSATAPAFTGVSPTVVVGAQTYSVTSATGEVRKLVPAVDTAITDGDTDDNFAAGPTP